MTDKDMSPKRVQGEVLSPLQGPGNQSSVFGSYFNRIRNEVISKELKSQADMGRAWHDLVSVMRDIKNVEEDYAKSVRRAEHLPVILAGEEARLIAEVQQIFDGEEDRVRTRTETLEDNQQARAIRRIRGEIELMQEQRKLDALKKTPVEDTTQSRGSKRVAALRRIRSERDEMIAEILSGRAENEASPEDQGLIKDIRLAAENEIKRFLEEDRD